jgi:hypothetical protein
MLGRVAWVQIGRLAGVDVRDILMEDFDEIEDVSFPKEGSPTTQAHTSSSFRLLTYAPRAFRYSFPSRTVLNVVWQVESGIVFRLYIASYASRAVLCVVWVPKCRMTDHDSRAVSRVLEIACVPIPAMTSCSADACRCLRALGPIILLLRDLLWELRCPLSSKVTSSSHVRRC